MTDRGRTTHVPARGKTRKKPGSIFHRPPPHRPLLAGAEQSFFGVPCRKWGFKRWGFKEIRGYLRKKADFLRFLDFPGALQTLWKRAKKAEKGRKRPIFGRFPRRVARHPLSPHLLHPHLRQPNFFSLGFRREDTNFGGGGSELFHPPHGRPSLHRAVSGSKKFIFVFSFLA